MFPHTNLSKSTDDRVKLAEHGFDLHRAYRAMIRSILSRQLLRPTVPSVTKEEPHA